MGCRMDKFVDSKELAAAMLAYDEAMDCKRNTLQNRVTAMQAALAAAQQERAKQWRAKLNNTRTK